MKKTFNTILVFMLAMCITNTAQSQITVVANTGYYVTINVNPTDVVPASNTCPYGYNYDIRFNYSVTFGGINQPASLYTLQGTMSCVSSLFFDLPNNPSSGMLKTQSNPYRSQTDCATITVPKLNCSLVNIEIEGPGISRRVVSFPMNSVLATKWESISAKMENTIAKINWATASEENTSSFVLQRSIDGKEWLDIQKVNAAGNSATHKEYSAIDATPLQGISYYRVREIESTGKVSYSGITQLVNNNTTESIGLYPVPNSGKVLNLTNIKNVSDYTFSVVTFSGISVYNTNLKATTVTLPALNKSMYMIRLTNKVTGVATNLKYIQN